MYTVSIIRKPVSSRILRWLPSSLHSYWLFTSNNVSNMASMGQKRLFWLLFVCIWVWVGRTEFQCTLIVSTDAEHVLSTDADHVLVFQVYLSTLPQHGIRIQYGSSLSGTRYTALIHSTLCKHVLYFEKTASFNSQV